MGLWLCILQNKWEDFSKSHVGNCRDRMGLHLKSVGYILWSPSDNANQIVTLLVGIADNMKPGVRLQ